MTITSKIYEAKMLAHAQMIQQYCHSHVTCSDCIFKKDGIFTFDCGINGNPCDWTIRSDEE